MRQFSLACSWRSALLAEGLERPAGQVLASPPYVLEIDSLGRWLTTMQRCRPSDGTMASVLFNAFTRWCIAQSCDPKPATQTAFGAALGRIGIGKAEKRDGNFYGIRFATPSHPGQHPRRRPR